MTLARKVCLALAATTLGAGLGGVAAPAVAVDSGWGCGGQCVSVPDDPAAEAATGDAADDEGRAPAKRQHGTASVARMIDSGWGCGGQC